MKPPNPLKDPSSVADQVVVQQSRIDEATVLHASPDAMIVVDTEVRLKYLNPAGTDLFGYDPEQWLDRCLLDMVHPDDVAVIISSTGTVQGKSAGTPVEVRIRTASGQWRWVEIIGGDALSTPGVHGIVVAVRDLTQRRMWEVASSDTVRFQQVVQHASSITLLLDRQARVSSVNAAFTRLLGHDPSLVVGRPLSSFCADGAEVELEHSIGQALAGAGTVTCEVPMSMADRAAPPRPIRFELVNLLDDPVVAGVVVSAYDVSDLHSARRTLEHLARHDALTGLANRSVLIEQLEQVIALSQSAAVVFIDLDRFKPVNDLFGHESGDELLRIVAQRLRQVVRPGDLVARVGGDEFVILSLGVGNRQAGKLLCDRIDATLAMPYLLAEGTVKVTASVGLAMVDEDSTVTGLLADADLAMYETKAARRGEPVRASSGRHRKANQRRRLADDLAAGLQRGEVVAHLQPVVSIPTGRTVGFEALARWNHPELGMLAPLAFLDLAEDAGLDLLLGDMVLRSACATFAGIGQHLTMGINLSVGQLTDRALCDRLRLILAEESMQPERLVIEITEHATLTRRAGGGRVSPDQTIGDLKAMGAMLWLDDFGTGYSSLTHIRHYPLSGIKIDRSFVAGVCLNAEDRAVVGAVVGMASAVGLEVVAEGVETADQLATLAELGCHLAQGHLYTRALAPDQVAPWFTQHEAGWPIRPSPK